MEDVETTTPRWASLSGLFCMLLWGIVFFGIVATIVLSLITVYLPKHNISSIRTVTSGSQTVAIPLSSKSNVTVNSSLGAESQSNLQNTLQNTLSSAVGSDKLANVNVLGTQTTNPGKRKRRQNSLATYLTVTYELIFINGICGKHCQAKLIELSQTLFPNIEAILITTSGGSDALGTSGTSTSTSSPITGDTIVSDISVISHYWSNYRPYSDLAPNFFGVQDIGLPTGCQIEQAHVLHRHAKRYPVNPELGFMHVLEAKVNSNRGKFTGPLSFLNTWTMRLGDGLLLPQGLSDEYLSGATFWATYGRILYNASVGQVLYSDAGQTKPLFRCNDVNRVYRSALLWSEGFFGSDNATNKYSLLVMPVSNRNNTLASYASCTNFANRYPPISDFHNVFNIYPALYLADTSIRLSSYTSGALNFTSLDLYAMQSLCNFEYVALGSSDYCSLFTLNEWKGYDYVYDLFLYNGFSFGQPTGRALGVGYLLELIARLKREQITVSHSTVNTTLDSSSNTFPLNQLFYLDMAHDFTVVGTITAMSIDYFRRNLSMTEFPAPDDRTFRGANLVPFAARLITEKIGCVSSNPTATNSPATQYTPTQYGYSPASATYKFIRVRVNSAILPLNTIQGGLCNIAGRTDGLCPLDSFLQSHANANAKANYEFLCYGSYNITNGTFDGDGTYFATS